VISGPDFFVQVLLDVPIPGPFDYRITPEQAAILAPGDWVVVPWAQSRRVGLVAALTGHTDLAPERVRAVLQVLDDAPRLPADWLSFLGFVAAYYHRPLGEAALPALPKLLRTPPGARARGSVFTRLRRRALQDLPAGGAPAAPVQPASGMPVSAAAAAPAVTAPAVTAPAPPVSAALPRPLPDLNPAQRSALAAILASVGFQVHLLHGVTGSGKTEVYLHWLAQVLARDERSQVLLMVPEIGLTPQLTGLLRDRFAHLPIAVLHSDLPDAQRAAHWLAAVDGRARLVVGTRLAILTPLPALAAIVVDEEHDGSYKQQEGVRYSARDMAVALASRRGIPVVLGSATPSLESWLAARRGRYQLLTLPQRVHAGAWPVLRRIDPRRKAMVQGLAPETREAITQALARGEQALVFMNRRGFAPVLNCDACGWLSSCEHCSAFRVLHRHGQAAGPARYSLLCHHCGAQAAVPRACPTCGNIDLSPLGRGTQRLEDGLREVFPSARIARLDRDVARHKGAARDVIDAAHRGEVDLLVGTQMLAKGHDFRHLTCVVVVDADSGLFSGDFRAPERLFAVLIQVAGRAGRAGAASEVIVQTRFPHHPLFDALARYDFAAFANAQLAERQASALPPFVFQALLRVEAGKLDIALDFLARARVAGALDPAAGPAVTLFDPVPMPMARLAGKERAQLLLESASRKALHVFLDAWLPRIAELKGAVRWQIEVDPIEI
jgi:primosomal protein N' (replication factor Y)